MAALLGAEAEALTLALDEPVPVSIRLHPGKPVTLGDAPVPWCAQGRYLNERPVFTLDPRLHAGAYYVQEASSMLIEQAVRATGLRDRPIAALDLCAAPGGKSTHLASLLHAESLLVCNEPVPQRRAILEENLWKHGRPGTVITGSAPERFAAVGLLFDLILVDAPCSGEGMFRKDPFARTQWNERLVETCARTQQDILHHAWEALAPGGWLLYSTCTWERRENEDQVQHLQARGAEHHPLVLDPAWGFEPSDAGTRSYPHRVRGEGFFLALLRKPGERPEHRAHPASAALHPEHAWLTDPERWTLIDEADRLHAAPAAWTQEVEALRQQVKVSAPGTPIAQRKGGQWRPHAALALNLAVNAPAFPNTELDTAGALAFLRGETNLGIPLNVDHAWGVRLVRYADLQLGWLHRAGDRWNNGWPKAWRIRMR